MDPYIGEIRLLPYLFAPMDWLPCDGSSQNIGTYQALFAVIGTTYGGDGRTTFKLPDLRSFIPVGPGGPDRSTVQLALGRTTGAATVTLAANQLPSHNHAMNGIITGTSTNRLTAPPTDASAQLAAVVFNGTTAQQAFSSAASPDTTFAQSSISPSGSATVSPHSNQQPYLPLNFMIAYNGIYPAPE